MLRIYLAVLSSKSYILSFELWTLFELYCRSGILPDMMVPPEAGEARPTILAFDISSPSYDNDNVVDEFYLSTAFREEPVMLPRVSVIIPTYNRYPFLIEAVESVLSQSYRDFELIVIDDGSEDNTAEITHRYPDRLRYFYQENQGASAARNQGIKVSRAELITFLDSDDLWDMDKLRYQVDFMESTPEARICYTDEIWIRRGVRVNPRKRHRKNSGWIFDRALELCIISPSSVMIRRELLQEVAYFDEELAVCEDYDLWLRIASINPIYLIDKPLIIKRGGHPDQLSEKYWGMDRFRVRALEKLLDHDQLSSEQRKQALRVLKKKCEILARGCYRRGKREEGDKFAGLPLKYEKG